MSRNHPADFGAWVRQHRKLLGLTQTDIAERAGVSPSYISTIERRQPHTVTGVPIKPERDKVMAIAKAVGGSPSEALVMCGYLPEDTSEIPEAIRIISFDGMDEADVNSIVDFILWKKKQNQQQGQ